MTTYAIARAAQHNTADYSDNVELGGNDLLLFQFKANWEAMLLRSLSGRESIVLVCIVDLEC
jgi:hypothetical protein